MPMRVLYDSQAFDMQTHGGVSRCFTELIKNMPSGVKCSLSVVETENEYLSQIGYPQPGELYNNFIVNREFPCKARLFDWYYNKYKGYHYGFNQNKLYNVEMLQRGKFDIFHPTFFDDYFLPYLNGKPFVLTIHDMIPFIYNNIENRNWKWQVKEITKLAPLASAIVTVSENTKKDVIKYLNIPEEKIHVIYHGANNFQFDKSTSKKGFDFDYVLYVGARNFYKNFERFVEVTSALLHERKELRVVCTGLPFDESELKLLKEYDVSDYYINCYVKDDAEFYSLYHNALAFVYPSMYEGFGIPILEAYAAGCPVLLNNTSCFPEIAKDDATYFNLDENTSTLEEKLGYILSLTCKERESLIEKQRERLSHFSWKKSSKQLVDVYKSLIK